MTEETWRFCPTSTESNVSSVASAFELKSSFQNDLQAMFDHRGDKVFLLHHVQNFPAYAIQRASEEGASFKKTVQVVLQDVVDNTAIIVLSHVLYKIKIDERCAFSLKASIAQLTNGDSMKFESKSDCSMYAPTRLKTLISMAVMQKWRVCHADV